jgi:pimeloyl-ACP methyl ester carboxylesterase
MSSQSGSGRQARRPDGTVVAFQLAGDPGGVPLLLCHGLADSRRSARLLERAAIDVGVLVIAPDRPGVGLSDWRRLERLSEWVDDAAIVLDALGRERVGVLGISGGGPFAAACAAEIPDRVSGLVLVSALGLREWGTRGMAAGERFSLAVATRAPSFGGWFLERLAKLARASPRLFCELATVDLADADRAVLATGVQREVFLEGYVEAFRRGRAGVAQELRVLRAPWGFRLGSIGVPTRIHHGEADLTVPPQHAHRYARAIPGARLRMCPDEGHFSLLARYAADILTEFRQL